MILAQPALALQPVIQTGAKGSNGINGIAGNPGTDGTAGAKGGNASINIPYQKWVEAYGGTGGVGGNGGDGTPDGANGGHGGNGGAGGDADAAVNVSGSSDYGIARALAEGGHGVQGGMGGLAAGGGTPGIVGASGQGGTATSSAVITIDTGMADSNSQAWGGGGALVFDAITTGGAGGAAVSFSAAHTTGDGEDPWLPRPDAYANGFAYGGEGGFTTEGGDGGRGGDASSQSIGTALSKYSVVMVADEAYGGTGGLVEAGIGNGGDGGNAVSQAIGRNASNTAIYVGSRAVGGDGGIGSNGGVSGNGGNAIASAIASSPIPSLPGDPFVDAVAYGGYSPDRHGGLALATVQATGIGGDAFAQSSQGRGLAHRVTSSAHIPVTTTVTAQAATSMGGPVLTPADAGRHEAIAYATGAPDTAAMADRLIGDPNATASLGSGSDILAYGVLGGGSPSDLASGVSETFTGSISMQLSVSEIVNPAQHLLIGLLDPESFGGGFDSFRFDIWAEGINIFDQTFTDPGSALTFFDDKLLDLGSWPALIGTDNLFDLQFSFSLTFSQPDSGFYFDFLAANGTYQASSTPAVPEPSILWLFGASSMAWAVRFRTTTRGVKGLS